MWNRVRFNARKQQNNNEGKRAHTHERTHAARERRNKLCCFYGFLGWLCCVVLCCCLFDKFRSLFGDIHIITHSRICILLFGAFVMNVCSVLCSVCILDRILYLCVCVYWSCAGMRSSSTAEQKQQQQPIISNFTLNSLARSLSHSVTNPCIFDFDSFHTTANFLLSFIFSFSHSPCVCKWFVDTHHIHTRKNCTKIRSACKT